MKQHSIYLSGLALLAATAAVLPANAQTRVIATDITNIAAASSGGRVLGVTSTIDNDKEYNVRNIIDGKVFDPAKNTGSKGWASDKFDPINMDYVTLAFKDNRVYKLGRIVLNPVTAVAPERWAKDVEVQVSTETAEGPYTAVAQLSLNRVAQPQSFPILPVDARFVRLVFRSNWGSDRAVALGEVEIYEAIDTDDPLGALIVRMESAVTELQAFRQTQIESSNSGGTIVTPVGNRRPMSQATLQMVQLVGGDGLRFPVSDVNVAAAKNGGKIMAYSSTFDNDPAYGPSKLIDGQNFNFTEGKGSFGWSSEGFEPGKQFVTIGFKDDRTKLIGKVTLNPVSNQQDLRWARRVDMQVTTESFRDGPWKTVASINLRPDPINQDFIVRPVEAKYVRFVFMANGPGISLPNADPNVNSDRAVSLGEIELYEAVSGGDQLGGLVSRFTQVLNDLKTLRAQQLRGGNTANADITPASLPAKPAAQPNVTAAAKPAAKPAVKAAAKPATKPAVKAAAKPSVKATPAKAPARKLRRRSMMEVAEATRDLVTWTPSGPVGKQSGYGRS